MVDYSVKPTVGERWKCNRCGKIVTITKRGRFHRHRETSTRYCYGTPLYKVD